MKLELIRLVKRFGEHEVLRQVSFTAASGKALGLLGRNGAGKTTTIRTIMNVFPPDEGDILLDGKPLRHTGIQIGYLPEEKGLYPKIKIRDQLTYIGELRGLTRAQARQSVVYWLERLEMSEYLDKKLETLSKGNQQKIQLAVSLLANPDIIILDEPFSGLDPVNAYLLKEVVAEQVNQGKIVLFSSHQMNYVEAFCDDVAILHQGEIVLAGSIRDIKRSYPRNRLVISLASSHEVWPAEKTRERLTAWLGQDNLGQAVESIQTLHDQCILVLKQPESRNDLLHGLVRADFPIELFSVAEPSLEDIFVEKTGQSEESGTEPVVLTDSKEG